MLCPGRATLHEWSLLFYGTEAPPNYLPPHAPPYPVNIPPPPRKSKPGRKSKSGSTTSKPSRGSTKDSKASSLFGKKQLSATAPPPVRKTPRPSVISARRPTTHPPTKPPLDHSPTAPVSLILLAPALQPSNLPPPLFPAIFQKYPKVQQLYPYSRLYEGPPRPSKKGVSYDDPLEARKSPGKALSSWPATILFIYVLTSSLVHLSHFFCKYYSCACVNVFSFPSTFTQNYV